MNKIILSIVAAGLVTVASAGDYVPVLHTEGLVDTEYVSFVEAGTLKGDTVDTSAIYTLLNKVDASSKAMSSVELNPDHEGLSMGLGISHKAGEVAGAVGVMYGHKFDSCAVKNLGYHIKAYNGEGGHRGVTTGVTVGF